MGAKRLKVRAFLVIGVLLWALLGAGQGTAALAGEERVQRENIFISSNSEFNPANGVRSGSGTAADPFVISNWSVRSIHIKDTSAHVVIKNNTIASQLVLNWNGPGVTVVDNTVGDLRVNQNIKRTGAATGGRIANNTFGIVGQLRHFDGVFENNLVKGDSSLFGTVFSNQAVQFDGFHGSRFRNNTIHGYVDVKLHGHHHGSGFQKGSHYHGQSKAHEGHEGHGADHADADHTKRYHEVFITGNQIYAEGDYALRYTDQAHAGDDRTAPSETNPDLNKEHVHFTRVHLVGNKLIGAGLMVDIFNASDQRHLRTERGVVEIRDNKIAVQSTSPEYPWARKDGISIISATDALVKVSGNVIKGESADQQDVLEKEFVSNSGIYLLDVDKANVFLRDNVATDLTYGVRASVMSGSVHWWVSGLKTKGVEHRIYWDNSVKNRPRGES